MSDRTRVFAGADTHSDTIHVAVVDGLGKRLGDAEFASTPNGYTAALRFINGFGDLVKAGVEGTGSYGRGLATFLLITGVDVVEVDRPDRASRRREGKTDPTDAYAAAWAAASGRATAQPKTKTGIVESIRAIHVARRSAVKDRTVAMNQLKSLIVTAPASLREQLRRLSDTELVTRCARFRVDGTRLDDAVTGVKQGLRRLAKRYQYLSVEIADADTELDQLTMQAVPTLRAQTGVGADVAAKLVITAGDNPERIASEAAFAHLTGVAPIPASSGRTNKHRLNRGGDRQANNALHTIARTRLRHCPRTCAYAERRTKQGLTSKDILRCLKRYIARDVHPILLKDLGLTQN